MLVVAYLFLIPIILVLSPTLLATSLLSAPLPTTLKVLIKVLAFSFSLVRSLESEYIII